MTLATAGLDMTVRLWDVVTGQERAHVDRPQRQVTKVQFSPDSNTLATADANGILRLWRADDDQDIETPQRRPHRSRIEELDRACALAPGRPEPLIAKAHYHHSHGETAQAEAAFSAAALGWRQSELDQFLQAGWWVVGPYPNELAAAYPPELNLDPARPVDGVVVSGKSATAQPLRWRHAPAIEFGRVNVAVFIPASQPCSVYAMTVVWSPSERPTALLLGTGGPRRVWLNGNLVDESTKAMTWHFDLDRVPVTLRPGRNTILVRIGGNTPPQFFITRLEDSLVDRTLFWRLPVCLTKQHIVWFAHNPPQPRMTDHHVMYGSARSHRLPPVTAKSSVIGRHVSGRSSDNWRMYRRPTFQHIR